MPCSFVVAQVSRAEAGFFNAALLRGREFFNFGTFWARIHLLWKDSAPLLRGDSSRHCGPARIHVAIWGVDTGPLESLRAMQFRGREWKLYRGGFCSMLRFCVAASCSISARFGRESPCYGRILGRSCVATVRATVALQGSMLGSWALTLGHWSRFMPCSFAFPNSKCAQVSPPSRRFHRSAAV